MKREQPAEVVANALTHESAAWIRHRTKTFSPFLGVLIAGAKIMTRVIGRNE